MERNLCLDWQAFVQEAITRRKNQGLTQQKLAMLAGVSKPTVVAFEHNKTTLTLASAFKILDILGLLAKT
jgi:transcriptional regulator with XRE-family HTH domain